MNKKSIIMIVLCLGVLFFVSNNIYHKANSNIKGSYSDIDKEKIKEDILSKIKLMSADDLLINLYKESIYVDDIDYQLMLKGLLLVLDEDGSINDDEADDLYEKTSICTNNSYISLDSVEKAMKNIYGTVFDINYEEAIKDTNYIYDTETNRFYEMCTNNSIGSDFIDTYIYNFDLDKNNVYVYVAVSYGKEEVVVENGETTDKTKVTIYTDYQRNNVYKSYIYDADNSSDNFLLDSSNYKDFSLYKYSFKKSNDNYYFESLEKVE